jgi:formylglycine-generating enzyme required for sulfatase activity
MKVLRLLILLLIVSIAACVAKSYVVYDTPRKSPKLAFIPPGTVWLRDSTFIDETEIRNIDYLEFLFWLSSHDTVAYKQMLPDSVSVTRFFHTPHSLNYYLRHPAYRDYPCTGISYEQAVAYCKWRTKMVNSFIYIQNHGGAKMFPNDTIDQLQTPMYVEYTLPTQEQWEYASAAGLSYPDFPFGYYSLLDKNKIPVSRTSEGELLFRQLRYNSRANNCWSPQYYYTSLDPVDPATSGSPNNFGIYNMLGNVSEIIQDSAFKGLNSQTDLKGLVIRSQSQDYILLDTTYNDYDYKYTFQYKQPQPWLGFRCVAVVKINPPK